MANGNEYTKRHMFVRGVLFPVGLACLIVAISYTLTSPESFADLADEATRTRIQFKISGFTYDEAAIDSLPEAADGPQAYSLSILPVPNVPEEQMNVLQASINAIKSRGSDVSCAIIDVDSGRGVTYDSDKLMFGASSFKAFLCMYICRDLIDTGLISSDLSEGIQLQDSARWQPVKSRISSTVINSNNETYYSLVCSFISYGVNDWLDTIGVKTRWRYSTSADYPYYSIRGSLKLWSEMYTYLETSDSQAARFLNECLQNTTRSNVRHALSGYEVSVRNKAGYTYIDDEHHYSSIVDAGIVECEGHTYVISVMTSLSYDESTNDTLAENVVRALFETRASLNY